MIARHQAGNFFPPDNLPNFTYPVTLVRDFKVIMILWLKKFSQHSYTSGVLR
jgi:hypothetical protein